ncbi:MAG: 3'-5' exonuclease [Pseudomonadota bacterium]
MNILVFDTETTGLPLWNDPSDHPDQPYIVDIAASLYDGTGLETSRFDAIVKPGVPIPDELARLHGITTEMAMEHGIEMSEAHARFIALVREADLIVGHNVSFDIRLARIQAARVTGEKWDNPLPTFCTMRRTTNMCRILKAKPRFSEDWKWPNLTEAVRHFFGEDHSNAHRARPDCDAAARIYFHLKEQGTAQ